MKMKKMSLEKKVFISSKTNVFFLCPPKGGHLSIKAAPPGAVSYKVKKKPTAICNTIQKTVGLS